MTFAVHMDQMPIGRVLVKNIVPAIAAMLMMLVYNLANKVFIAMENNDYRVTAVTLVTPVFLLFMAVGNIFGTGGVALMSRLAGENNKKKINHYKHQGRSRQKTLLPFEFIDVMPLHSIFCR